MAKIEINYKYNVGQIVYFMYNNEIRKGIVARIQIDVESKRLDTYLTKKIVNKIISIFDKEYPMKEPKIRYSLDLVSKSGDYESCPHIRYEYDIFENQKDIIKELSLN